ncbi:MAG: GtrA family protein [Bacteroidales bacterium]
MLKHISNLYNHIVNHDSKVIEFLRFGIVGAFSTLMNYALYLFLLPYINTYLAFTIGYGLSFIANFYLSVYFTFKTSASLKKGFGFGLSQGINYLIQLVLLYLFILMGISKELALIPVIIIVVPISFVLVRTVLKSNKL